MVIFDITTSTISSVIPWVHHKTSSTHSRNSFCCDDESLVDPKSMELVNGFPRECNEIEDLHLVVYDDAKYINTLHLDHNPKLRLITIDVEDDSLPSDSLEYLSQFLSTISSRIVSTLRIALALEHLKFLQSLPWRALDQVCNEDAKFLSIIGFRKFCSHRG